MGQGWDKQGTATDRSGRRWAWFWVALLLEGMVALVPKWSSDRRVAEDVERWERGYALNSKAGATSMQAVFDGLQAMQRDAAGSPGGPRQVTRAEVEAAFGSRGSITWLAPGTEIRFHYADTASGYQGEFHVHEFGAGYAGGNAVSAPQVVLWGEKLDPHRRAAIGVFGVAWCALLGLTIWRGRRYAAVRHLLPATAVVLTFGWLLDPTLPLHRLGWDAGDSVRLGLIMIGVSVGVSLWAKWRGSRHLRRDGRPACERCGYDLSFNESGVCPECGLSHGYAVASPVVMAHRAAEFEPTTPICLQKKAPMADDACMSVPSNLSNAAGNPEPATGMLADHQERSLTSVVDAMRCPVRLRLLLSLCTEGPQTVGTLAQRLCITQPTTSHNLGLLRMSHLVTSRRDGKSVWYEFAADRVECGRRPRADGSAGDEFTVAIRAGAGVMLTLAAHDPASTAGAPARQALAA